MIKLNFKLSSPYRFRAFVSLIGGVYALVLLLFLILRFAVRDSVWWVAFLSDFTYWYFLPLMLLFPLALFIRAKRGMLLMLPLVLIGVIWFGRYFLPKATAQASETTLSVITFNVWGANPQLASIETWLREQDADVVFLQEALPSWLNGGLAELRDVYPFQYGETTELGWWGSVILSKYPAASEQEFAVTADGVPYYQRLTLDVNGESIAVYNMHVLMPIGDDPHFAFDTQNGFLNLILKYDPEPRNAGIRRLLTALDAETYPFIVGGDFNMSDQATIYGDLAVRMDDSFREAGYGFGASWPIAEIAGLPSFVPPLVRIDYVWHSRDFQAVSAAMGPHLNSDHLPLSVTLSRVAR
jgi:endonuclease/exonuclease/phosphatase (EEP) superfamily protein YafD